MDIRYKDIITLDDGHDYVVTSMANYENNQYYYVVNIKNISVVKFLKLIIANDNFFLKEVVDDALILKLMPILLSNIIEDIK